MLIAVINECRINGVLCDGFWKIVSVPSVPILGTYMWMRNDDGMLDMHGTVERIEYWEGSDYYEVFLKMPFDSYEGDESEIVQEFEAAGWTSEGKKPLHDPPASR